MRPDRKSDLPVYSVVIDEVTGGEIANILRGHIIVSEQRIRFTGVAYGRYGGQNVAPRFSPAAKKKLKMVFGDLARFEEDLQMKLISGDFDVNPKAGTPGQP